MRPKALRSNSHGRHDPDTPMLGAMARPRSLALWIGPRGLLAVHRHDGLELPEQGPESPDPNIRYLAYPKLASPRCYDGDEQKAEAVAVLVERLERATSRWPAAP